MCPKIFYFIRATFWGTFYGIPKKKSNHPMFRVFISFFFCLFFRAVPVGRKKTGDVGFPILSKLMGEGEISFQSNYLSLSAFCFITFPSSFHALIYIHILEKKRDRTTWHHHRYLSRARSLPPQSNNNNKNNNFVNLPFPPRPRRSPSRLQPRSRFTSSTAKSETTFPALRCSSTKQTRRTRVSLLLP